MPEINKDLIIKILVGIGVAAGLISGGAKLSQIDTSEADPYSKNRFSFADSVSSPEIAIPSSDETDTGTQQTSAAALTTRPEEYTVYHFRNRTRLDEHFEKHGKEMGFSTAEDYERRACDIINDPNSLFKIEAEDGDGVYYVESSNEFVILSTDGYIRTYYICSGRDYFDRQ